MYGVCERFWMVQTPMWGGRLRQRIELLSEGGEVGGRAPVAELRAHRAGSTGVSERDLCDCARELNEVSCEAIFGDVKLSARDRLVQCAP